MRLELEGVSVTTPGRNGRIIVREASLRIDAGEFVGLVGPNGAGKSTLLRAALGLQKLSAGKARLGDTPLEDLKLRERARRAAYLPQERRVEWRLAARDVVLLGRHPHHDGFGGPSAADRAAAQRALRDVDAFAFVDRPVSQLSGGERARVLLARALAVEAPLLLADEPAAALDPYHQLQAMEILRRLADEGGAVLAVLHDLSLAVRFMDRVVLMHEGRIVADGAPADVLSADNLAHVFGFVALRGETEGERWMLPWRRVKPSG